VVRPWFVGPVDLILILMREFVLVVLMMKVTGGTVFYRGVWDLVLPLSVCVVTKGGWSALLFVNLDSWFGTSRIQVNCGLEHQVRHHYL